jgi:tRNA threonylcarbamoyladenosine biosynthesis protein TsaB
MIVLGFDTATPATAVGLLLADGSVREERDDPAAGERPGHSTRLLALAYDLLADVGLDWTDLERIAVGLGPGTFTGLRIGVATARGLAQSCGAGLAGVSSLRALAEGVDDEPENVLAVIDARRGEVFVAAYGARDATGVREQLLAPSARAPERLEEALSAMGGEERGDWIAVGDGALRYPEALAGLGMTLPEATSALHLISGRAICELGAQGREEGLGLVPDYGRRPDAELALRMRARR